MSGSTVSPSDPDCSLRFPCYGDCGAALKERLLALVSHDIVGQHVQETVKASIEKDTISRALGDSEACGFVTMPSLCSFAGPQVRAISTPVTRQHDEVYWRNLAFTELKQVVGECVVEAVVESKRAYGLLVRLRHAVVSISAELRVSARALPLLCDLGVKGMCHILDDSPDDRKSKLESTPISIDDFREGDSILAAVVSVDVESERVNLSLRNSNVFSVQSMWAKASSATFCDLLNSNQLFHNPHALELLTEAYALDEAGSMLPKVPVPKKYMYTLIRDQQNNQWAKETVERGLEIANKTPGDPAKAISLYKQVLEVVPNYADAHVAWGCAHVKLNQLEQAIPKFQAALRINPNHPRAATYLLGVRKQVDSINRSPIHETPPNAAADKLRSLLEQESSHHKSRHRKERESSRDKGHNSSSASDSDRDRHTRGGATATATADAAAGPGAGDSSDNGAHRRHHKHHHKHGHSHSHRHSHKGSKRRHHQSPSPSPSSSSSLPNSPPNSPTTAKKPRS